MKSITPLEAIQFPLHDAVFVGLEIIPQEDGLVTARFKVKIHPDEMLELAKTLSVTSRNLCFTFRDCMQIKTDIFGYDVRPETVDDFNLVEDSELKNKMVEHGNTAAIRMVHFHLAGSKGSKIDILAKTLFVEEHG